MYAALSFLGETVGKKIETLFWVCFSWYYVLLVSSLCPSAHVFAKREKEDIVHS